MNFNDIEQKTKFSLNFPPGQKLLVLAEMRKIYNEAKVVDNTAKSMFDSWIVGGNIINIKFVKNKFRATSSYFIGEEPTGRNMIPTGTLEIDLDYIKNGSYIDFNGNAVKDSWIIALVHEFGHALTGSDDNHFATAYKDKTSDYRGDNINFVNQIYKELGLPEDVSYLAYNNQGNINKTNYQYTNGTPIDNAVSIGVNAMNQIGAGKNWDSSKVRNKLGTASNDLLIGDNRQNELKSGEGNDFLFGNGGNDILDGGTGSDTAVYYGFKEDYRVTQKNGNWTVQGLTGLGKTAGTDTLKSIEFLQFDNLNQPGQKETLALNTSNFKSAKNIGFVFDTTTNIDLSTFTEISSLNISKTLAFSILDDLFDDPNNDIEIGVVAFNDATIGNFAYVPLQFTDQKAAAINAIDSLTASYGGDIPETSFDGLRLALDGSLGQWRLDGGTHQIFLFTDAPAKDYVLADYVTALAHNVGATIASTATATLGGGAVNTFNLVGSSLTDTTQVQIYTVFTGAAGTDTTALSSIANNNSGALITASTNTELLNKILEIINAPPVSQKPTNDFNGDGKSDILWRNTNNGSVAIWSLDGTIVTPHSVGSLSSAWTIAGTGDFNGDLTEDILWRNSDGTVVTWQLDDSTFAASTVLGTVGADWQIAGTGDFNGDSESDILWRNDDGTVALWQLNDSEYTDGVVLGTVGTDWQIAGTADFNSDGESDILWRNDDGRVAIWQINDLAYTAGTVIDTVSNDWKIEGTGDFDGDGNADILWRNDDGRVALWQMDGTTITNGTVIDTVADDWKIAGTGDFNDDGKSDILWRSDLGSVVTWQMDGSYVVADSFTSIASADLAWKIAAPIVYA